MAWTCGALVLAWALLLKHLSVAWTVSPNYHFGWLVPLLALYFFFTRWYHCPPAPLTSGRGAMAAAWVCALLVLPVWWIRVATPDWSAVGYALAALVTGWTFFLLAWRGGWGLAVHLAFAVFFIFCAVPWPQRFETWLTQSLSQWVAFCTVEMLQWAGIAAERAGHVVALPGGLIEVSEACSGVRSLQAMAMAGLCLGEIRRFSVGRRVLLVAVGLAMAMVLNVLRNFGLAMVADAQGMKAVATWHDSAGWSIFLVSVALLILVSRWMTPPGSVPTAAESHRPPVLRPLPTWASVGFAAWFALAMAGTEAWYSGHERQLAAASRLRIQWPEKRAGFRFEPIADTAQDLLRASEVRAASWEETPGHRWTMTAVRWAPGETATQSARMHYPDVCLPAVGTEFVRSAPPAAISFPGGELTFHISEFLSRGRKAFVFFALREESNRDRTTDNLLQDWSPRSRIQRAWTGQRNLGQQSIALAVTGMDNATAALQEVTLRLPELIALEAPPGQ
jgi:exosortase